jgi:hypothetical protein
MRCDARRWMILDSVVIDRERERFSRVSEGVERRSSVLPVRTVGVRLHTY